MILEVFLAMALCYVLVCLANAKRVTHFTFMAHFTVRYVIALKAILHGVVEFPSP